EFDADYVVRSLISGHRGPEGKPVTLVISVDGKPLKTATVESARTQVTVQGGATQRTTEEVRVFLTEGPHKFRAEFVNDDFAKELPQATRLNPNRNIYPESFELAGPFPPQEARSSRGKLLVSDPAPGS